MCFSPPKEILDESLLKAYKRLDSKIWSFAAKTLEVTPFWHERKLKSADVINFSFVDSIDLESF